MRHWPSLDAADHTSSLSTLAAIALRRGEHSDAVALADRRCRIGPPAQAHDFMLRAAALSRIGLAEQAAADLAQALRLDPENLTANRWLVRSSVPATRRSAAEILVRIEDDPQQIIGALETLEEAGIQCVGKLAASTTGVSGWLAWRGREALAIDLHRSGGSHRVMVDRDPLHPFSSETRSAADCTFAWPSGATATAVQPATAPFLLPDAVYFSPDEPPAVVGRRWRDGPSPQVDVTVIVPVHGNAREVEVCLTALMADDRSRVTRRILVVDDASNDAALTDLLKAFEGCGSIELLRQEINGGFARAVNAALELVGPEDVLLLNADTVVPPGFLDRLRKAAHSGEDIGTVTPLSNNGEYTSFPVPFDVNPMPRGEAHLTLDRAAERANSGRIVDLPSGIGFCLYIRRNCLEAVGPLSTAFGRGYYEDVDFCLRAAKAGFRNICAADVYVAHAGTRSFRKEKRGLVVRNLRKIERRHPHYQAQSAAFLRHDPLRPARAEIERCLRPSSVRPLLVMPKDTHPLERARLLRRASASDRPPLVATVHESEGRVALDIAASDGRIPQNLRFVLDDAGPQGLAHELERLAIECVTVSRMGALHPALRDALRLLDVPLEDAARDPGECHVHAAHPLDDGKAIRLGLIVPDRAQSTTARLIEVARSLHRRHTIDTIVLGSTADDLGVMREAGVFVTGAIAAPEYPATLQRLGITHVVWLGRGALDACDLGAPIPLLAHINDALHGADDTVVAVLRWIGALAPA